MAIWNLRPGVERPLLPEEHPLRKDDHDVTMTGVGNLTPEEVVRRAEVWGGATIKEQPDRWRIVPPDKSQPVIFIARRWGRGADRSNAISRLRRVGIDVVNEPDNTDNTALSEETPVPSPAAMPARNGNGSVHTMPTPAAPTATASDDSAVLEMLAESEARHTALNKRLAALETACKALERDYTQAGITPEGIEEFNQLSRQSRGLPEALERLAEQVATLSGTVDAQRKTIGKLERDLARAADLQVRKLAGLEARLASIPGATPPAPEPPSPSEILRRLVLEFFEAAPRGMEMDPASVERNIRKRDDFPKEGIGATAVAMACRQLVLAGKLQGAAVTKDGKPLAAANPNMGRGMYWLDAEPATATGDAA